MKNFSAQVSVIVPVYNVVTYLEACVRSVQRQSYPQWEMLLVDDGSTDGSGLLCDKLAENDTRIRVIHKENGGLSDARNVGMKAAKGTYFYFLDSDDLLPETSLEKLVALCEGAGADAAMGQLLEFEKEPPLKEKETGKTEILSAEEAIRRMLLREGGIGHTACAKLFRKELWAQLQFPKGILYEDYAVIYKVIQMCRTVAVDYEPVYYYRMRNGSIMHEQIREQQLMILDLEDEVTRYIAETMPDLREEAEYLHLVMDLKTLKRILNGGFKNYPDEQERILRYVREHGRLTDRVWAKKADRIKVKTLRISKRLFYWIYTLAEIRNHHAV